MERRSLRAYREINDAAGIAEVCASLADLELSRKHAKKAEAWLDEGMREAQLAPRLGDSFRAYVVSLQAWLAELRGHNQDAIAGHQKEIDYLVRSMGEDNPTVGWAYMLLGNAYLKAGDSDEALKNMLVGRAILGQTLGTDNIRYLAAQVVCSEALKSAGMRAAADQTRADAEQKLKVIYGQQCTQCRITMMALH
jgi:tetratricopeptide (TPR) repeat protein